jgi:hypothetical protein
MQKIIISFLLFVILFVLYFQKQKEQKITPIQESPKQITLESARNLINKEDCQTNINFLASDELEGRMSGKKGNQLAAEYIKNKINSYGLKTILQKFNIKKTNPGPKNEIGEDWTENVYGLKEGSELKDEIVVVGAHFDHIGYGPKYSRSKKIEVHNGADDNASGSVALLEVAKAISKLNPKRTVLFQFYSAEEMGLIGSRYYCENPLFPEDSPNIKNHVAMINLDMIGHLNSRTSKVADLSFDMNQEIKKLLPEYPFALKVIAKGGGSDHVPFNNKGVPSVFIHTGTHPYYHTPDDDVSTLDIKGMVDISKFVFDLTWNLANQNKPEKTTFENLPFDHDHGEESF